MIKILMVACVVSLSMFLEQCSNVSPTSNDLFVDSTAILDSIHLWERIQAKYPDFYTQTNDYFITRLNGIPSIAADTYALSITGLIDNPCSLSLSRLYSLPHVELPVTVECIGNPVSGRNVSTAIWGGFDIYNLLDSLGLDPAATGVKYRAADGYYVTHTLDQLKTNNVLGAMFMNGDTIPPVQGFPLRILNPGFYGAKQPAWVTSIEVLGMPESDYWDDRGWDTSPRMPVDTRIFFPFQNSSFGSGDTIEIGGAAFGGTRTASVEVSTDQRLSWQETRIVRSIDADNVWVFWYTRIVFTDTGKRSIFVRSTDIQNNIQPETDTLTNNGNNAQPYVVVNIL